MSPQIVTADAAELARIMGILDLLTDDNGRKLTTEARGTAWRALDPGPYSYPTFHMLAWGVARSTAIGPARTLRLAVLEHNPTLKHNDTPTPAQILHALMAETEATR